MNTHNTDKNFSKKPRGQILKEAREAKGVTLDLAHDATKIPMDVLRAIEEGYTVRTLSTFYLKGFIKMYARFLGVDVKEVLADHQEEKLPPVAKERHVVDEIEDKTVQVFSRERQQLLVKIVGGLLALFLVVKIGGCIKAGQSDSAKNRKLERIRQVQMKKKAAATKLEEQIEKKREANKKEAQEKEKKAVAVQPKKKEPQPKKIEVKKEKKKEQKVLLTVKAKERGWLQVKVDGVLMFQSVLKKGVVETWEAKKEIEISGKNIHNLEFNLNGKALGGLGWADRNARRVVITKDGLSVKK
ncbi:MAG: DUF4115 domain-containing protein [Candidatus Omnitrophica bacterium]|nr:DUF4115 domain-containing protein [Candidatus Omnitrophota bacterium]